MLMMKNITKISAKKNIALLWGAQMISSAGDAIYQLALLWIVLDITGSSVLTGLVAMGAHMPAIFLDFMPECFLTGLIVFISWFFHMQVKH